MTQAELNAIRLHFQQTGSLTKQQATDLLDETGKLINALNFACGVISDLLAEVKRLRCCGNCEYFETVCGEGKCFVECEEPAWRFDKKLRYTDGSGKCEKWGGGRQWLK